jgi:hypothetical protein
MLLRTISFICQTNGFGCQLVYFCHMGVKAGRQTIRHQDLQRSIENLLKNEPEIEAALLLVVTSAKQRGAQQTILQLSDSVMGSMIAHAANNAADAVAGVIKKYLKKSLLRLPVYCPLHR